MGCSLFTLCAGATLDAAVAAVAADHPVDEDDLLAVGLIGTAAARAEGSGAAPHGSTTPTIGQALQPSSPEQLALSEHLRRIDGDRGDPRGLLGARGGGRRHFGDAVRQLQRLRGREIEELMQAQMRMLTMAVKGNGG